MAISSPGTPNTGSHEFSGVEPVLDLYRMGYDFESTLEDPPVRGPRIYRIGSIKGRPLYVAVGWPWTIYRQFGRRYVVAQAVLTLFIAAIIAASIAAVRYR